MGCDGWREQISARTDGEATVRSSAAIDHHLAGCPSCRAFAASMDRQGAGLEVVDMPDLARSVTREVARDDRRSQRWPLRAALMVVAAAIAWQAVPQMVGEDRLPGASGAMFHAPVSHDTRHAGAFGAAFAVGLLIVAVRPARARALLPVATMAVAALALTSIIDATEGSITLLSERQHLPEVAALALVWLLARGTSRRPATPTQREVTPLRVVDDDGAAAS